MGMARDYAGQTLWPDCTRDEYDANVRMDEAATLVLADKTIY